MAAEPLARQRGGTGAALLPWRPAPAWRCAEVLPELIGLAYQGASEAQPWFALAERLRHLLGARNVTVTLLHRADLAGDIYVMSEEEGGSIDWQLAERTWRERFAHIERLHPESVAPGQVVEFGPADVEPACAEFFAELGLGQCLRSCFAEPGGMRCWLDVLRAPHSPLPRFHEEEVHLLHCLAPHLAHALGLYARLQRQEAERAVYAGSLEHLQLGCLLLDGEARSLALNRTAEALLARHSGVELLNGRLQLRDKRLQLLFEQAIARALVQRQAAAGEWLGELLRVPAQNGALLGLLIAPTPLQDYFQGRQVPSLSLYLVELSEPLGAVERASGYPPELIAQLFALTRQEARLVACLADGQSISEAAVQMGIAVAAARNYSKNIYAKLGLKGQTDLVRMLCRSRVLLRR